MDVKWNWAGVSNAKQHAFVPYKETKSRSLCGRFKVEKDFSIMPRHQLFSPCTNCKKILEIENGKR